MEGTVIKLFLCYYVCEFSFKRTYDVWRTDSSKVKWIVCLPFLLDKATFYLISNGGQQISEIMKFESSYGSWLIGDSVQKGKTNQHFFKIFQVLVNFAILWQNFKTIWLLSVYFGLKKIKEKIIFKGLFAV